MEHAVEGGDRRRARRAERNHARIDPRAHRVETVVDENASAVDHDDPLGERLDLLQVVARHDDRRAVGPVTTDRRPEAVTGIHVEARRRLVQQHQPGASGEGERHRDAALLPARQRTALTPKQVVEAELRRELPRRDAVGEVRGHEVDDLADAQGVGQRGLLRSAAEGGPEAVAHGVTAEELDGSGAGSSPPLQQGDEGRLAGSVRAEEPHNLAGADLEADIVEGNLIAEAPAHAIETGKHGHEEPPRRDRSESM